MRMKLWTCATSWVQGIMKEGGFSLRKWNSNCEPFCERIKQDEEKKNQAHEITAKKNNQVQRLLNCKQNDL